MIDQIEGLKKLAQKKGITSEQRIQTMVSNIKNSINNNNEFIKPEFELKRVISVTSGKGGVGKTNISANLAIAFQRLKKETILMDADLGSANIDAILGYSPEKSIRDILSGQCKLEQAMTIGPEGIKFIAGESGESEFADIMEMQRNFIVSNLKLLENLGEILLIDTGAGISKNVLCFVLASKEIIVIATPEPSSIADAYGVIKTICEKKHNSDIKVIVNRVRKEGQANEVFDKLNKASEKFLNKKLEFIGAIPEDENVWEAVLLRKPFISVFPNCRASKAIMNIAQNILNNYIIEERLFNKEFILKENKGIIDNLFGFVSNYLKS